MSHCFSVRQVLRNRASEPVTASRLQTSFSCAGGGGVAVTDVVSAINISKTGNIGFTPSLAVRLSSGPARCNRSDLRHHHVQLTSKHHRML